jgi:hypothetical protein
MRGGSLPALQRLLGHATLAMTMRYAHLAPEHPRTEIARTERPRSAETAPVFSARISARTRSGGCLGSSCSVTAVLLGSKLEPAAGLEPATC